MVLCIAFAIALPTKAQKIEKNEAFNNMLAAYYDEGLTLNPLGATQRGDNRFNDQLPNTIAAPYINKMHNFNVKYQQQLKKFNIKKW